MSPAVNPSFMMVLILSLCRDSCLALLHYAECFVIQPTHTDTSGTDKIKKISHKAQPPK